MNEQKIKNILTKIESWMMMTCEGCAMPEKLNPLIDEIKKLLDSEASSQERRIAGDMGVNPSEISR
ncbi:MAG TPA: hypothetical protein VN426_08895 [Syntrophomonadaceae bacterium]|nr:hypothetical protein [Syntrophomonadaceae bacterium]